MFIKSILIFTLLFIGSFSSANYKSCKSVFLKKEVLLRAHQSPEHSSYNAALPWLESQNASPLQLHIWKNLAFPGKATNQRNEDLVRRGLITPNGGLCAVTCGTNLMQAIRSYYRLPSRFDGLHNEIQYIVNYIARRFGHDAREGLMLDMLADTMVHLITLHGLQQVVRVDSLTMTPQSASLQQLFPNFSNSAPILGVKGMGSRGEQTIYHAMVATSYNSQTGRITLMDPNNPWQPIHAQIYKKNSQQDHWAIKIDSLDYPDPYYYINDVLNITSIYKK